MKVAVFIGRFQPFHIGHLSVVERILENYQRLLIVIGSAQESGTDKNPWTVQEREQIIRASIPLELQERIDIAGLEDVPDDDEWGMSLLRLIGKVKEKGKQRNGINSPSVCSQQTEGVGGVENLNKGLNSNDQIDASARSLMTNEVIVFTGNDWVQGICERHGIQTEWINYDIKISGTEIREKLRKGEDVSLLTCVNKI